MSASLVTNYNKIDYFPLSFIDIAAIIVVGLGIYYYKYKQNTKSSSRLNKSTELDTEEQVLRRSIIELMNESAGSSNYTKLNHFIKNEIKNNESSVISLTDMILGLNLKIDVTTFNTLLETTSKIARIDKFTLLKEKIFEESDCLPLPNLITFNIILKSINVETGLNQINTNKLEIATYGYNPMTD